MSEKPKRLLRLSTVCDRLGYSSATIWRLVQAGKFPKPVKLVPGRRAVGWPEEEIDAVIDAAIASREGALVKAEYERGGR